MLKVLKIASLCSVILALAFCCGVSYRMVVSGPVSPEILNAPGAIEAFQAGHENPVKDSDQESPFVVQARLFANAINPRVIIQQEDLSDNKKEKIDSSGATSFIDRIRIERPPAKFKLIGTVCCEGDPGKSFAYLDVTSLGKRWYGKGDSIDRKTIQEIKSSGIILYQNGKFSEELRLLPPKTAIKSLLQGVLRL